MKIYITFGQNHAHRVNNITFDCDSVAVYEAENYEQGRKRAFELFDAKFHMCYAEDEWDDKKLSYFPRGLVEVEKNPL